MKISKLREHYKYRCRSGSSSIFNNFHLQEQLKIFESLIIVKLNERLCLRICPLTQLLQGQGSLQIDIFLFLSFGNKGLFEN